MAFLKRFKITSDFENSAQWIKFDEFFLYVRSNLQLTDGIAAIKKENVRQEL